jgi:hypothetical protein
MDVTGASAWPSRLDIEILYRRATQDDTEGISIRSTPSVVAFVLAFETVGLWMQALRCQPALVCGRASSHCRSGCRRQATVHRIPWRSAARGIRSARSGLARACHRGIVVLTWIDGYIVFLTEGRSVL